MRAQILTPWAGDGLTTETAYHPQIADDYPILSYTDATGQPAEALIPGPNLFVAEIECDAATLAAIEADAIYYVLWSES